MKRVQFSVHRTVGEARMLAGALESAGLSVDIRGESLAPLSGEIPSTEAWVELWLWPQELEAGRQVLSELHANEEAANRSVTCPRCGEEIPANFELCWSCGLELPSGLRPHLRAV
ncbi:zinc ribbon domain-containing protein [Corallococcus sp. bb12-1]|uniref:zinc ribbon domain-containing protein n=1 Tax=Corallococcus sp. bb12-1 TaxID=2996784 RepID=UPI00226F2F6A|nr:zinc ribbon domain-containing protein [Corallococcus sp. bb12-1]MCY1040949.1 zinc ribbon domain-containing protein [Corallococcus sp. bb12-1]